MPPPLPALSLTVSDREQIGRWLNAHGTPQHVVVRSRIVLAAAAAASDHAIAKALAINRKTVRLWRTRFAEHGLTSLWEIAPGRGRKPTYDAAKIEAIVDATLQTTPWSWTTTARTRIARCKAGSHGIPGSSRTLCRPVPVGSI